MAPPLLPVAERVHTDADRPSKLNLREPDEAPKRRHICARLELLPLTMLAFASWHKVVPAYLDWLPA